MPKLILFTLLALTGAIRAEVPDQVARWNAARLDPKWTIAADKAVTLYLRNRRRYETISQKRTNAVPPQVIFGFHGRESSWSFACHLHEGSPLTHRTRFVPKGRIPGVPPPYTWEVSAEDAIYAYERLDTRNWSQLGPALQEMESYNGLGYQGRHLLPSPYLWSGTTLYKRGKYVADGRFSPTAVDQQLGLCAILKRMRERGVPLPPSF